MKQTTSNNFKAVSIQFKAPERVEKVKSEPVADKSKPITVKDEVVRFATQIRVAGNTAKILKEVLLAHRNIKDYAIEVKRSNPNLTLEQLTALAFYFADKRKLKDIIVPGCIESEVYYINKKADEGTPCTTGGPSYLTFLESSFSNKRFTLSNTRKSIFFEDLDIVLRLSRAIPKFEPDGAFHLNLGAWDLENLEDLNLTVFYKEKQH